jgi:3-methyladenine DNA glycosylase AlkD
MMGGDPVDTILAALKKRSSKKIRDEMAPRYGIVTNRAFGVRMADMKTIAKPHRGDHDLAAALWATGWYEARTVAALLEDPAKVTPAQMDRWARDFDNWAICDTVCFHLFDRTPHAFAKVNKWSKARAEFVKRAAFALLASLALHDRKADAKLFAECMPLIEQAATDDRNFVKKGVSWALRSIGRRRGDLAGEAASIAQRLSESDNATARWIGKDALRDFKKAGIG